MQEKFLEFREKYPVFNYEGYNIEDDGEFLHITYDFQIPGLCSFSPKLDISKKNIRSDVDKNVVDYLVFQIGLIELISYVKCTCSKKIVIKPGYVDDFQINWLKKLYYNGLSEFLYTNKINVSMEDLFDIECLVKDKPKFDGDYKGVGNLICVGGGKDSCVSLEILKDEENNSCFIINGKGPSIGCCKAAGYEDEDIIDVKRILDRKIVELNKEGFLNGHTPFSAIVAFISYLSAYLMGKKNIILSNESSANQATVHGTSINHQYSKSFEFESDFVEYMDRVMGLGINYFSLLRGISEFEIGHLFSNYKKYHSVFKSCNLGSKEKEWKWCCNCSKCLFVFMILSPNMEKKELVDIFGQNLYEREDLLPMFKEILGFTDSKPFECVGTYEEARYAVSLVIDREKDDKLDYLLEYYKNHYDLELDGSEILRYNENNNLNSYYNNLVKEEVKKYESDNRKVKR